MTLDQISNINDERHPMRQVVIDWGSLIAKRKCVLEIERKMPRYLLYPEVLMLLEHEKHPTYRLILDIIWCTGAKVAEVLALKPSSFVKNGDNLSVQLTSIKSKPGRPVKEADRGLLARNVPIEDPVILDRIQCHLTGRSCGKNQRIFSICRQTLNRHIHALTNQVIGLPFPVSTMTLRHSFAIHLVLHDIPLQYISYLLGHKSIYSTEIYTKVLNEDNARHMEVIKFH